ncbi:MAG: flagellar biosynthetic protein FliR [Thermoguttaceae bacterium]
MAIFLQYLDTEKFLLFTFVLTRVTGLLATAPVFGAKEAPMEVRALLAGALAALILPAQWQQTVADPGSLIHYLVLLGGEFLIGASLGLGLMVLVAGLQMAAELVSRVGGLAMSDVLDPTTDTNVPLLSQFMYLVGVAVFLGIGGHRTVMAGLLDSFATLPPGGAMATMLGSPTAAGGAGFFAVLLQLFLTLVVESFQLCIRAAVPVVTTVLLATLVIALIGRTLPQLNIMAVGFGLNSLLTFAVLSFSLGAVLWTFQAQIEPTLELLLNTLKFQL